MDQYKQVNDGSQDGDRTDLANVEYAHLLKMPPDEVDWDDLVELKREDPAAARLVKERLKKIARHEVASGERAADAVEDMATPWERAQFLAIRDTLIEDWQPVNALERLLIDAITQAYIMRLRWLEFHQTRLSTYGSAHQARKRRVDTRDQPRISIAEVTEQSAAMIDRFDRMMARNIRALRDLRRYTGQIMIQHAGQVNIGAQQINAASDGRTETPQTRNQDSPPVIDCGRDD